MNEERCLNPTGSFGIDLDGLNLKMGKFGDSEPKRGIFESKAFVLGNTSRL